MSLKKSYLKHCKDKDLEINENQIKIVQKLSEYYNLNFGQSFIKKLFKDKKNKLAWIKEQKESIKEFKKQKSPEFHQQFRPDGYSIDKEKWFG